MCVWREGKGGGALLVRRVIIKKNETTEGGVPPGTNAIRFSNREHTVIKEKRNNC